MSEAVYQLRSNAPRFEDSPYVLCPAIFDGKGPLEAHPGVRGGMHHRAATDIANSGVPIKVDMALTAQKTITHDPIRAATEKVANLRRDAIGNRAPAVTLMAEVPVAVAGDKTRIGIARKMAVQCHQKANERNFHPRRWAREFPVIQASIESRQNREADRRGCHAELHRLCW
jgi:hypothetical protein